MYFLLVQFACFHFKVTLILYFGFLLQNFTIIYYLFAILILLFFNSSFYFAWKNVLTFSVLIYFYFTKE